MVSAMAAAAAPRMFTFHIGPSWCSCFRLGLRVGATAGSAQDGGRSAADYEARKRAHQNSQTTCDAEGLQFVPLVAEACAGGWAPTAASTWKHLARTVAGRTGEAASVLTERLQQTLALTLQRENARAILRGAGDALWSTPAGVSISTHLLPALHALPEHLNLPQ